MITSTLNQGGIVIEDPSRDPLSSPFLILALFDADYGTVTGRENRPEFTNRTPSCVNWSADAVHLTVTNLGKVASDLVKIEYEIIFCTLQQHGLADAFNTQHAEELHGSTRDDKSFIHYVPPSGKWTIKIPLRIPAVTVYNIYFRARVSTLWSGQKPIKDWNFASDPAITEAWKRWSP